MLEADGITLTPEEIVRLNALAWDVESPGARMGLSRGVPVFVCGIPLWPLTIHAEDWYSRIGCRLKYYRDQRLALAFAMAHCYSDPDALDRAGQWTAGARVWNWARKLRCRRATLEEAISQVIQQDECEDQPPGDEDRQTMTAGDIALMLAAMTGRPAVEYERLMSVSAVKRVAHYAVMMQDRAQGASTADGAHIEAERAEGWYIHQIKESRKAESNGKA